MMATIKLELTSRQALILWKIIDGAADAGACDDGLYVAEAHALDQITDKLLSQHSLWKGADYPRIYRNGKRG
jgi:hypothetical protein